MLRRLRIQNLVLIHGAELGLAPGLNAITGETGAGKTILAQAIGLLLGGKGDAGFIGPDGGEAYVEAELELPAGLLEEDELASLAELRPEDEEGLVVARRVFADGRTRAYAWGRGTAREDLAAVGERFRHITELVEGTTAAAEALASDEREGAADLVAAAERAVAPLERLAPELSRAADELRDAELRLREAASELRGFLTTLEAAPG